MLKRTFILVFMVIAFAIPFSQVARVGAFDTLENACDGSAESERSTVCQDRKTVTDPVSGAGAVVPKIANIMALVGGIIAVVIIMINGLKLMTSTGDSSKLTETRNAIIYATVGIVVIVTARLILSFITRLL